MTKTIKILTIFSGVCCILVIALCLMGILTFGHGLGDLYNLFFLFIWLIILATFFRLTRKTDFSSDKIISIFIIMILIFSNYYIIRLFTVDRGSEFKWDGHVFLASAKAEHRRNRQLKFKETIDKYDSIIKVNPKNSKVHFDKGLLLRHAGQYEKSIEEYKKAIILNPKYFDALYECADSYSSIHQYEKAIEYYERAIKVDSSQERVRTIIKNLKEYHHIK